MQDTNINGGGQRSYVKVLFPVLAVALFVGVFYFLYSQNDRDRTSDNKESVHFEYNYTFDPKQDSTQEYIQQVTQTLDARIQSPSSDLDRIMATLEKAYLLSVSRNKGYGGEEEALLESTKLLTSVYESTLNNPDPLYTILNEKAAFGYVLVFGQNVYNTSVISEMSESLRNKHFGYFATEKSRTDEVKIRKKEAFKGMDSLLTDTSVFSSLVKDKSFNSESAMIRAVYLDMFNIEMSQEDRTRLAEAIRRNVENYRSGEIITAGKNSVRLTMLAPFQLAFADYAVKKAIENKNDYSVLDQAATSIQNATGDDYTRAHVLLKLKIYTLGILEREGASEEVVQNRVNDMRDLIEGDPYRDLLRVNMKYNLENSGQWFGLMQDFFALADRSSSLSSFLRELGVKGY